MRPEKREKGSARYQFHDNHDGLLLDADPNEPDNVGVVVLFENPTLLEELFLVLFGERHLASFGCHCNHQVWSLGQYHLVTFFYKQGSSQTVIIWGFHTVVP